MDRNNALELLERVPENATEIIIKGRSTREVFFSMPKDWRPSEEQKAKIVMAPQAIQYHTNEKPRRRRWRISL